MSKRDLRILACIDGAVLFAWLLVPFKNLTPQQLGFGIGLTAVLNLVFISKRSGLRFLGPQEVISIRPTDTPDSKDAPPLPQEDPVNPGFTVLRVLAGFMSIVTFGQLIFIVLDVNQGNMHDALRSLVRLLFGSYIVFWLLRVTRKIPKPS